MGVFVDRNTPNMRIEPTRSPPFAARHFPVDARTGELFTSTGMARSKLKESERPLTIELYTSFNIAK